MPAIAEADDGFLYALKFRGAGQGSRALIAELICGEIARALGFKIPELVFANLDEAFGRTEPDEEIQDLLRASEPRLPVGVLPEDDFLQLYTSGTTGKPKGTMLSGL